MSQYCSHSSLCRVGRSVTWLSHVNDSQNHGGNAMTALCKEKQDTILSWQRVRWVWFRWMTWKMQCVLPRLQTTRLRCKQQSHEPGPCRAA